MKVLQAILYLLLLSSCMNKTKTQCEYKMNSFVRQNSNMVNVVKDETDSVIKIFDRIKDTLPCGLYTFSKNGDLLTYDFLTSINTSRYKEQYDIDGNLVFVKGIPLVQHQLQKKSNDTINFTFLFFSLHKRYTNIQIITNKFDVIHTKQFESKLYTNIDCVSFDLKAGRILNDLVIYTKASYMDSCLNLNKDFNDTVSFKGINM